MSHRPHIGVSIQGIIDPALPETADRVLFLSQELAGLIDGLEIGFFLNDLPRHAESLATPQARRALAALPGNTLHIARRSWLPAGPGEIDALAALVAGLAGEGLVRAASFHLNLAKFFPRLESALGPLLPLGLENSDALMTSEGQSPPAEEALDRFPAWHLVFDAAHAMELAGYDAQGSQRFAAQWAGRIRQMHISWPGNLYQGVIPDPNFDTRHSFLCLAGAAAAPLWDLAAGFQGKLITVEGVIPPGPVGVELLKKEIAGLRAARDAMTA